MSDVTPPCQALTYKLWLDTLSAIADSNGRDTAVGDLADFAHNVLSLVGEPALLAEYLDSRGSDALEGQ